MRQGSGIILLLTLAIPGCRPNAPRQAHLERRWLPGVYLCEVGDQVDTDAAMRAYGGGQRKQTRIRTTEMAELTVGEADATGLKRLVWRPRRMVVDRDGAACDSESESASPSCFVPRAMVKTAYAGHVNPDGAAAVDGLADDGGSQEKMWSAFGSWMTPDARWEVMMGDLRRVLAANFVPVDRLPHVVSTGESWSSNAETFAPAFSGVIEIAYRHRVERIDDAPGGRLATIVSTSTGGVSGRSVTLGAFSGRMKDAELRSTGVFDNSLGVFTNVSKSASVAMDVDFGPGVTGTLESRYESSTTCRRAGR